MMDIELVLRFLVVGIALAGAVIAGSTWLPKEKKMGDWLTVVGSLLAWVSFCLLGLDIFLPYSWNYLTISEGFALSLLGVLGLGLLMFSAGFVMDRWSRRNREVYESQMREIENTQAEIQKK